MPELGDQLSNRELDVLACLAKGASNREIADELVISENTVKVHLRRIYIKLGVSSRTEAIRVALTQGLTTLPDTEPPSPLTVEPNKETEEKELPASSPQTIAAAQPKVLPFPNNMISTTIWWRRVPILTVLFVIFAIIFGLIVLDRNDGLMFEAPIPVSTVQIGESRWFEISKMVEAHAGMATASRGFNLYLIGGETKNGVVGDVAIYHVGEHTWQIGTPKPTPVMNAAATVLGGELYVIGGRTADNQLTSVVEVYSPSNDAWRTVTALPQPIEGVVIASDSSFIYIVGGQTDKPLTSFYRYDSLLEEWQTLPAMSTARAFATGGILRGQLYVVGGIDREALDTCERFILVSQEWQSCPSLSKARGQAGSAILNHTLYVVGGETTETTIESYNPLTQEWQIENLPFAINGGWVNLSVAQVESRLYVFGGRQGGELVDKGYVFAPLSHIYLPAVPVDAPDESN